MKLAPTIRAAALVTAVALLPVTTASLAAVEGRAGSQFGKLFAVYQRIKTSYVEPVEDDKLVRGAIDGMLASLDPHSGYVEGSSLQRLNTLIDGNYQGLGISIIGEDGGIKIISPMRGSPAEEAGLKAGDYITHIDGKLIYGLEIDDAVAQMRGPAGTSIRLTIIRPGRDEPFDTTVTRGVIELEPVTHELQAGNVGVITVNEFSKDVGGDVYSSIKALEKEANGGLAGLVLDLRSNPGGSLDEAVALSDLFLSEGQIVSQRGRTRDENMYFSADDMRNYPRMEPKQRRIFLGDVAKGLPIIVLIDAGSASASEIVAGALQDQGRAVIMGERSFGKGSVQSLLPLSRDSAIKLTTARYYTPSGRAVQEGGIEPDINVPQLSDPDAAVRAKYRYRESDLRGHLINEANLADKDFEKDRREDPRFTQTADELKAKGIEDFQLHYAMETLRRTSRPRIAASGAE